MNIFYFSNSVDECAEWAVDRHVVKMILETSQLLSTAHRILDGTEYTGLSKTGRKVKRWRLPDHRDTDLYTATHVSHPCAVWVRQSNNNYNWLYCLLGAYLKEYTYRYGKVHSIERSGLFAALATPPHNIPVGRFTQPAFAMDAKYIISDDARINYKNYYNQGKSHLFAWKKRSMPEWITEKNYECNGT